MADADIPTPWHHGRPVLIVGFLTATLTVLASFLPSLTPERLAAINALVVAGGAFFTQSQVTPV